MGFGTGWRQLLAPWSAKQVDGEGVGIAASGKSGPVCCRVPSMCHPLELDNCCHESFASSTPLSGSDITASHGLIEISVFEVETLLYQHEITYCVADSVLNLLREPLDGSPDVSESSTIVLKCHSHMSGFVIKR